MAVFERGDFPRHYAARLPYINKLIGPERWKTPQFMFNQLFKFEPSKRIREEFPTYAGLGLHESMTEGAKVNYDKMVQGPYKSFTHVQYGLGFQIGFQSAKQDLDGFTKKYATHLRRSLDYSLETQGADILNGAFATYTTADGQYLCSDSHTYIRGGGTWDNKATAALGHTALEAALVSFMQLKDMQGQPQPLTPAEIWYPPALDPMVHELLKSRTRHDSTTDASSYVYGKVSPKCWPFITTSTYWFIMAPKADREIYWFWNSKPFVSHGFDFDTHTAKTKNLYVMSMGAVDPRGIYGSTGGS